MGENAINKSTEHAIQMVQDNYWYGKSLYTFNQVIEPTIDTPDTVLYIKFPVDEQTYYQIRYPYQFESFHLDTLQCIVEQLNISPGVFSLWFEKSMHIKNIEQIYDQNTTIFNEKVIKTCGILIGYFFRPKNEYPYLRDEQEYYKSGKRVRIFDASSSYTSYMSHIAVALFLCIVLKLLVNVFIAVITLAYPPWPLIHASIQEQMQKIDIFSFEYFDELLSNTTYQNNYQDCLFIVYDKYLIISMINFNETSEKILRLFYNCTPLTIVPIDTISNVKSYGIMCDNNNCSQFVSFPTYIHSFNFNPAPWLHERLMAINDKYRDKYV